MAQIILSLTFIISPNATSKDKLQFSFGESLNIYSEKAFRKNNGTYFEAIGNVVIISGKDTLYGEKASFDVKNGKVVIEGSVRFINEDITLYGSKIYFNSKTKKLVMENSRIVTDEFSLLSVEVTRESENQYHAKDAEFTTCRDCSESWKIYGKDIAIELNRYITINHALIKIKGIDVLYIPYIVFPIKNKRESGLLFPLLSSTEVDGVIFKQPYFWALNDSQDMTIVPTFYSKRGTGLEYEYRQLFSEESFLFTDIKAIQDDLYFEDSDLSSESDSLFRYFGELETRFKFGENSQLYLRGLGGKELDFVHDFNDYTDDKITTTDVGLDMFYEKQFSNLDVSLEFNPRRNVLFSDSFKADENYTQVFPRLSYTMSPFFIFQSERQYLSRMLIQMEGESTAFRKKENKSDFIREAVRHNLKPLASLNLYDGKHISLSSNYLVDYQEYHFEQDGEQNFYKNAGVLSTKLSFGVEKIFGVAYEAKYNQSEVERKTIDIEKKQGDYIGALPVLDRDLVSERVVVKKNSYKHSQDFNFIHHQIVHNGESGNRRFLTQIEQEEGWFDDEDGLRLEQETVGANETRKSISQKNTLELQWNNMLLEKSPRVLRPFKDRRYLKDNFNYKRLGYFNVSQGYLLSESKESFEEKLTRLFIESAYYAKTWNIKLEEYYFHESSDHIFDLSAEKKFSSLSFLAQYNFNSFPDSNLKTIKVGTQYRPFDALGLSYLNEKDLDLNEDIINIYQLDFIPDNNCWIFNINYRDSFVEKKFSFNFVFNFGSQSFRDYKENFFDFDRIQ